MTNKIDNSFGVGSTNFQNQSKSRERTPGSPSFGDFMSVEERDDEFNAQSQSAGEQEESSTSPSPFSSIFGNFGSSGNASSERDDVDTDSNNSRRTNNSNSFRPEHEDKPGHKPHQKVKPKLGKENDFEKAEFQDDKKEIKQNDPLPAFQVPIQVDRMMIPQIAPVEKAAPVVPPQMMDQIVQDVRLGINAQGLAEFQFDLKSDVLEGLKLKISTKDGQVNATFIAENIHVKEAIDQGAQELIQALQDRGLEVANLQVNVGADTSGGGQGQSNQSGDQQQQQQRQSYSAQGDGYGVDNSVDSGTSLPGNRSNTDYTI